MRFVIWMIDNFFNFKNLLWIYRPPNQFHVSIKLSTDNNEVFWFRQFEFCVIGILGTKWTSLVVRVILPAGPINRLRSAAAGLQRVASLLVFTDVVTVSRSHQDKRVRRGLLCGA